MLKQGQNAPLSLEDQTSILYALVNGFLDDVDISKIRAFEDAFRSYMAASHSDIMAKIVETKEINDEIESGLNAALEDFKANVPY